MGGSMCEDYTLFSDASSASATALLTSSKCKCPTRMPIEIETRMYFVSPPANAKASFVSTSVVVAAS